MIKIFIIIFPIKYFRVGIFPSFQTITLKSVKSLGSIPIIGVKIPSNWLLQSQFGSPKLVSTNFPTYVPHIKIAHPMISIPTKITRKHRYYPEKVYHCNCNPAISSIFHSYPHEITKIVDCWSYRMITHSTLMIFPLLSGFIPFPFIHRLLYVISYAHALNPNYTSLIYAIHIDYVPMIYRCCHCPKPKNTMFPPVN